MLRSNRFNFGKSITKSGSYTSILSSIYKVSRFFISPMESGIEERRFFCRAKRVKFSSLQKDEGI